MHIGRTNEPSEGKKETRAMVSKSTVFDPVGLVDFIFFFKKNLTLELF